MHDGGPTPQCVVGLGTTHLFTAALSLRSDYNITPRSTADECRTGGIYSLGLSACVSVSFQANPDVMTLLRLSK